MKKLLSKILVLLMILTTAVPVLSFAVTEDGGASQLLTVSVSGITTRTATIKWEPIVEEATYEVTIKKATEATEVIGTYDANTHIVSGLNPDENYKAIVKEKMTVSEKNEYKIDEIEGEYSYEYGDTRVVVDENDPRIVIENDKKTIEISQVVTKTTQFAEKDFKTEPLIPTNLNLIVQAGGFAKVDSTVYNPGQHIISTNIEDTLMVKSYSNAGYKGAGAFSYTVKGTSDEAITVKFSTESAVYGNPFYVADGYFSGYHADGEDINKDHNPQDTVLEATMTATQDKAIYALGDTAKIELNVTVSHGDNGGSNLNEVDFYENELNKQTVDTVPVSTPVAFTTILPDSEGELTGAGFVLTKDATHKTYTKTLNYDLVDRYNGTDAAAILAKATAKIIVKFERPANLWIASDDGAYVYIDGEKFTENTTYATATSYTKHGENTPFVAAKAWDTTGEANISGFKLVLQKEDGAYLSTNSNWYYYNKFNDLPPSNYMGKEWYKSDYKATAGDWSPVTTFTLATAPGEHNWAADSQFAGGFALDARWIWSPNYNVGEGEVPTSKKIDTPVYLRSMAPVVIPTMGTITVNKDVINKDGTNATDATPFNFTYVSERMAARFASDSVSMDVTTGEGVVIEGTPTTITLPFGTYTFTETTPTDKYTDITTGGSVTITVSEEDATATVLFVNQLKTSTSEDPGTPVTPTRRTTTTTIVEPPTPLAETPIPDEPAPLADILDPNVPQTNDSNNILLLLGLLFGSGAGIAVLGRRKSADAK